jgi:hypothetical protein
MRKFITGPTFGAAALALVAITPVPASAATCEMAYASAFSACGGDEGCESLAGINYDFCVLQREAVVNQ